MAHEYTSWAWSQGIRGSGRKSVLVALADRANGDGYSYPGQKTLADMTGQSERSVREHVEWLEENGYVRRKERRRSDGTRTSDGYNLPPMDSTGNIRRWTTTGKTRRLTQEAETPDQGATNTPSATGKNRRQSTGRIRQTNRQISPSSPAESAGHELPGELPDTEPLTPLSLNHSEASEREEEGERTDSVSADPEPTPLGLTASDASVYRQGRSRGQTDSHLPTFHPETFKLLVTFRKLHGTKANDEMFRAWATTVRRDIHTHGEPKVISALETTIGNFASLNLPFSYYEACVKRRKPPKDGELAAADDFKHVPTAAELLGITGETT